MKKFFTLLGFVFLLSIAQFVYSHGTVIYPASRIYSCYTNGGSLCTPCGAAIYDWMSVLQPHTNYGNHQAYVPDGRIASGGNAKFSCLDALTTAWPATTVNHGYIDVQWRNSAPHQSEYYKVFITPLNWDPTKPLRWSELIEIGQVGKRPAESYTTIRSFIPATYAGRRAAIVSVWQRDFTHSHEAFYSVSDILVGGGGSGCTTGSPLTANFTNNTNCTLQYYQNNSLMGSANAGGTYTANTTVGSQWQARRTTGEQVSSFTIACGQTTYNSTGQCAGSGCTTGSPLNVTFTNNTNCTLQYYQNNSLRGSANAGGSYTVSTTVGSVWQARRTSGEQMSSFTIACGQTSYNSTGTCGGSSGGCAPAYGPYPKVYMRGNIVSHNGRNYESLSDNLFNVTPGTASWWWKDLGPCSSARISPSTSASQQVVLYPVPVVKGTLNIRTLDQGSEACHSTVSKSIVIFDGLLRKVQQSTIVGDNNNLDVSNLAPGIYYLQIEGISNPMRIEIK